MYPRPLKFILLVAIPLLIGLAGKAGGLTSQQCLSVSIFLASILGTLFFWDFRLSFVFLGTSLLLITKTIDLENLIKFASLEIILFLVGMMVLIGVLKESGFFAWIVSLLLRIKNLSGRRFLIIISIASALLACAIDEVTSIIFMVAAMLEICDYFETNPVPFIISSVLATNIGSAGTVLGNPIGILIAVKSGLTFEDFIIKAFPLAMLCLTALIFFLLKWYEKPLKKMDQKIKELGANEILVRLISVPPDRELKKGLIIFGLTLVFISLHHRLEILLNLEPNTILLIVPLIAAGAVMIWRWQRARGYIEKDVEWWTLLFFMLLFAQAGALKYTGTTDILAKSILNFSGGKAALLIPLLLVVSAIGSSVLDNVVLVAAFIPVVQSFKDLGFVLQPLWWALLFGGCLGGNITLVGSTANIVALGILEKETNIRMTFFRWFWVGLFSSIITVTLVGLALTFLPFYK